ncbi:MAG: hypothetical protein ACRDYD_07060, partial [Acidimicrobiales bacterium]
MRGRPALLLAAAALAAGISSCSSSNGHTYAVHACTHVERSLSLFEHAQSASDPAIGAHLKAEALAQLRQALPPAALAASDSGQYAPLATTLQESGSVPEARLVPALRAQCASVGRGFVPPAPGPNAGRGV